MGRHLAMELKAREKQIRILCLFGEKVSPLLENLGIEIVFGDITQKETLATAVAGVATVYHLAAVLISPHRSELFQQVNEIGTHNLVEASIAAGVEHFIYVSSISVIYSMSNAYSRSKLAGENRVKHSALKGYTLIRPSLAYADGGAEEFNRLVSHLRRGPVVMLPGGGRAIKSPIHIDDLTQVFVSILGNARCLGKTYTLTGGDDLSLREMTQLLLTHMGKPKSIISLPIWTCYLAVGFLDILFKFFPGPNPFTWQTLTGLIQNATSSDKSALKDLNFHPRRFKEGLVTLISLQGCLKKKPNRS